MKRASASSEGLFACYVFHSVQTSALPKSQLHLEVTVTTACRACTYVYAMFQQLEGRVPAEQVLTATPAAKCRAVSPSCCLCLPASAGVASDAAEPSCEPSNPQNLNPAAAAACVCLCCRSTFLGSRALAGTLLKHKQLSARGPDGLSLEELLKSTGVQRPAEAVAAIALDPKKV